MPTTTTHTGLATRALERVRDRIRAVAVGERLIAGLAGVGVWLLGIGLIDYTLRLPGWLRLLVLGAGLTIAIMLIVRKLLPAVRLRPKLSTVALRLEQSELGRARALGGVLASGIALGAEAAPDEPASIRALRTRAAAEADARLTDAEPWKLIDTAGLRRRGMWTAAVVAVIAALAAFSPTLAWTGLARQVLPFGAAKWPQRYAVADATRVDVHPIGVGLPVRALVTKTTRVTGQTPVSVVYRVVTEDGPSPTRREPLTPQRFVEYTPGGEPGEAYERLLEVPVAASDDDAPARLVYHFETPDGRTDDAEVLLVEQPEILGIDLAITPPEYASGVTGSFLSGPIDAGDAGRDRRLIGPVLAGSAVQLTARLNKPAAPGTETPLVDIETGEPPPDTAITGDSDRITIAWTADATARLQLGVRDRFGLGSLESSVLRVEVVEDAAPRSAVTLPVRDESVLATAVIDLRSEGRDDVALSWVGLSYERAIVPSGSEGAPPEPDGQPTELAQQRTTETRAEVDARLDLSTLGLRAGDAIDVYGLAADGYERAGASHGVSRSDPRRLRIISETELVDELLAELGAVRRTAIRLDEQQSDLGEALRDAREAGTAPDEDVARRQGSVGESLSAAAESIERVGERLARNGLVDEGLSRVVREAAEAADRGARAAEDGAEAAREAGDAEQPEQATAEAQAASDEVRRALEDLARALDRGEDAWSVRRSIEGILRDQAEVSGDTASAGAAMVGRAADELTEQERSVLDEIARRQLDLAERAAELLDELEERAEQSAEQDPGQSAAMRAAGRRGREQGVSQMLREASRAVQQNRAADAGRAQQDAQEQLEEMLRDLEDAERQRDAELQRALLSLVETIESLVRDQESELARLDAGEVALAGGMTRLHRNTLSTVDEATRDLALAPVAAPLREAAEAQDTAVVLIRASADIESIRDAEQRSLARLRAALEAAEQALEDAEQREQERARQELQAAYRAALETQVAITRETAPFAEGRLSRRDRAAVRELGEREQSLRDEINAVREAHPELTETTIFDFAHARLDSTLGGLAASLGDGEAGGLTPLDQASVERVLRGLIASLDSPEGGDEQDFNQGGGGGGGGPSGPQPLIPPIAELQMLRALQQDVYDRTRAAEQGNLDQSVARRIGDEQRELAERADALLRSMQQQQPMPESTPGAGDSE